MFIGKIRKYLKESMDNIKLVLSENNVKIRNLE